MAIQKMRLLRLSGTKENIENIIVKAFSSKDMHAELASTMVSRDNNEELFPVYDVFSEYLSRIETIMTSLHVDLPYVYDGVSTLTNQEIDDQLSLIENIIKVNNASQTQLTKLTKEDNIAIEKLRDYKFDLKQDQRLPDVIFGRMPVRNLVTFPLSKDNKYSATIISKNTHYAWILYQALSRNRTEGELLFEKLKFESITIPKFAENRLNYGSDSVLCKIYAYVKYNAEVHRFDKYITVSDHRYMIMGYVPQHRVEHFKEMFSDIADVDIQDIPDGLVKGLEPPTILKNNWFARPFELFIELYGLPRYGEFDPTFYVAFTYCLLFGIMFGDLGQGLVLVIVGALLYRKTKGKLWGIVHRLGYFSMFFGVVYGSVFGDEHILNPLYHALGFAEKPIEVMRSDFTTPLLLMAVGLGAALILTSMIINIVLQMRRKNVGEALFSQNGMAGFIFYGSLIIGAALQLGLKIPVANPLTIALFIVSPLVVILFRVPLKNLIRKVRVTPHEGWGGYMSESIFELLEVLLSFMSNTMSFLRVGGFVLSHAGMMVVVMKLTEMTGNFGIITLIFGNIFVIGLEGLIVGIQTLRLEFYEMFSRYFEGGGKKFIPTTL